MVGALLHDLGKASTPYELLWDPEGNMLGKHHGHEDPDRFRPALDSLSSRICMPSDIKQFAYSCALCHQDAHKIHTMGDGLAMMYIRLGLERQLRHDPAYLDDFLVMCHADSAGRLKLLKDGSLKRDAEYPQADYTRAAMAEIAKVKPGPIIQAELAKGRTLDEAKAVVLQTQRRTGRYYKKAQARLSKLQDEGCQEP